MKLKSFGCSHVYGSELPDLERRKIPDGSALTWPALLAEHLNLQYHTSSWPGRGNLFIAEQVLNHVLEPGLFVINWTYIDRFDFKDLNDSTPLHFPGSNWTTCRPSETDQINKTYYKHFHSEYANKLNTLIWIKTCIDALNQNKRSFIMTFMDDLILDQRWHTDTGIQYLQNQVSPYLKTFNGKNCVRYAQSQGHPVTDSDHLTAAGHRCCADYAISNFGIDKIKTS